MPYRSAESSTRHGVSVWFLVNAPTSKARVAGAARLPCRAWQKGRACRENGSVQAPAAALFPPPCRLVIGLNGAGCQGRSEPEPWQAPGQTPGQEAGPGRRLGMVGLKGGSRRWQGVLDAGPALTWGKLSDTSQKTADFPAPRGLSLGREGRSAPQPKELLWIYFPSDAPS